MTDFKAKMHQIRFRLGFRPRPRWGSLQCSPRPSSWIWGCFAAGEGWAGKGEGGGSGGEGKEGPPSYCWTRAPQSLRHCLCKWFAAAMFVKSLSTYNFRCGVFASPCHTLLMCMCVVSSNCWCHCLMVVVNIKNTNLIFSVWVFRTML